MNQHNKRLGAARLIKHLLSCAALWGAAVCQAQPWPAKNVRIVVPYATGGGSDSLARQIGASLQALWGRGIVIDNKPGASSNIGSLDVVRSAPDGYTLLLQNNTMVINQAVVTDRKSYDPLTDLTPIMLVGSTPLALVANPSVGVSSVKELLARAKSTPTSYGSCGIGSPQHLVMEVLKEKTGLQADHVAYKGCAPALTDVVGGQIPYAVLSANMVAPYLASGKLKPLAVSTSARYNQLPDTPSFEEQGFKPFDFTVWYALMGPAKLAPQVVAKIRADVEKVLANEDVRKKLSDAGIEPLSGGPDELVSIIKADQRRYSEIARAANIRAE